MTDHYTLGSGVLYLISKDLIMYIVIKKSTELRKGLCEFSRHANLGDFIPLKSIVIVNADNLKTKVMH